MTHLGMMVLFAAGVSAVFAALMRDDPHEQLRLAGRLFVGFVLGAFLTGWMLIGLFR